MRENGKKKAKAAVHPCGCEQIPDGVSVMAQPTAYAPIVQALNQAGLNVPMCGFALYQCRQCHTIIDCKPIVQQQKANRIHVPRGVKLS